MPLNMCLDVPLMVRGVCDNGELKSRDRTLLTLLNASVELSRERLDSDT